MISVIRDYANLANTSLARKTKKSREFFLDVTKTGNGKRGTGNRERKSGNECTAVTRRRIQNGQVVGRLFGVHLPIFNFKL